MSWAMCMLGMVKHSLLAKIWEKIWGMIDTVEGPGLAQVYQIAMFSKVEGDGLRGMSDEIMTMIAREFKGHCSEGGSR